jgi:uroporphyrinogen decarboxylase
MRQAGRYMATYQAVRKKHTFLEVCRNPELACEVAMMPIDQLGVDAAILFSDIMVPLEPMGIGIDFNPGPILSPPVRSRSQIDQLRTHGAADDVSYVYDAVQAKKVALNGRAPLLGFAGSPFTLATYAVEGGTSRHHHEVKQMAYNEPAALESLLEKITIVISEYLRHQVDAGADAIQLFDTWGGIFNISEWRRFSLPYAKRLIESLSDTGVPVIFYIQNGAHLWEALRELPCEVLSVDWRQQLGQIKELAGGQFAIQGNLDPGILRARPDVITKRVHDAMRQYGSDPGLILNLGHGITPDVTVDAALAFVKAAQNFPNAG